MALFSRSSSSLIGLDISSTAVKLLELSQSGDRYRVEAYSVIPLPANSVEEKNIADVDAVGNTIKRAVQKARTRTKNAAVAVAGSAVLTKISTMPANLTDVESSSEERRGGKERSSGRASDL